MPPLPPSPPPSAAGPAGLQPALQAPAADAAPLSPIGQASAPSPCSLCEHRAAAAGKTLCGNCGATQRRLFYAEAIGGGFCFVAVAVLLYLLGRWYAG